MTAPTREKIEEILISSYRDDPRVLAVYLFGSQVTGRTTRRSDVDVAFHLTGVEGMAIDDFILHEMGELESLLHSDVHVVVLNRPSHLLRMQVFKKGRLVLERDPLAHRRFRAEALVGAGDSLPFWRRYTNYSLSRWLAQTHG